jgi:hypothetical protein
MVRSTDLCLEMVEMQTELVTAKKISSALQKTGY